jgi:hypothetical protein
VNDWRCSEKGDAVIAAFSWWPAGARVSAASLQSSVLWLRRRSRRGSEGRVETRGSRLALPVPVLHNDDGWTCRRDPGVS